MYHIIEETLPHFSKYSCSIGFDKLVRGYTVNESKT
jgi:hypothetical protein